MGVVFDAPWWRPRLRTSALDDKGHESSHIHASLLYRLYCWLAPTAASTHQQQRLLLQPAVQQSNRLQRQRRRRRQLRVGCDADEHPPEVQATPTDGSDCEALAGKS